MSGPILTQDIENAGVLMLNMGIGFFAGRVAAPARQPDAAVAMFLGMGVMVLMSFGHRRWLAMQD